MRQIRLSPQGLWHRPIEHNGHTACDLEIDGPFAVKDGPLELDLCPICWTPRERDSASRHKAMRDHANETGELYFHDDEEPTEPEWILPDGENRRK